MPPYGRTIDAGEAGIKNELRYSRGGLNFDLQDVRLRWKRHPELQLLRSYLIGHGVCGLGEHFVRHALGIGGAVPDQRSR